MISLCYPKELEKSFFDDLNISNAFVYLNKIIRKKDYYETEQNKKVLKEF